MGIRGQENQSAKLTSCHSADSTEL